MHTIRRAIHAFITPVDARRSRPHDRTVHALTGMRCPACGSVRVTGNSGSWICHGCGAQGQG